MTSLDEHIENCLKRQLDIAKIGRVSINHLLYRVQAAIPSRNRYAVEGIAVGSKRAIEVRFSYALARISHRPRPRRRPPPPPSTITIRLRIEYVSPAMQQHFETGGYGVRKPSDSFDVLKGRQDTSGPGPTSRWWRDAPAT